MASSYGQQVPRCPRVARRFFPLFLAGLYAAAVAACVAAAPSTRPVGPPDPDGRLTPAEIKEFGWDQEIIRPDGLQIHFLIRTAPSVDAGWKADRFPEQAACYRTPKEIADLY